MEFTHLHVHTEYSLLDGSSKIKELVARAKELGMDSLAITDHGVMYGVIDFYKAAKEVGIKPILGCEVYVAPGSRFDKDTGGKENRYNHLVLLAENDTGYHNLMKLVSRGFTEGFYYKPRVDYELLERYHEGIIALSACLAGRVSSFLRQGLYEEAKEAALRLNKIFGDGSFFLEMQDHGLEEQRAVNQGLLRLHKDTNIPLVVTNDIHYIYDTDEKAHDILLCIQTQKKVQDTDRMRYEGGQYYLKSPEQMEKLFPYAKEALLNTHKIAERCNVEIVFGEYKLPRFDVPEGYTAWDYLQKLCKEGLKQRYPDDWEGLLERLQYELDTIHGMGFVDYFLIVGDFIKYAKDNGIPVGPGRGSAAGSIVAYSLGITDIDPIKYNLLFERFLNPERITMPDIDIDFCFERRHEVMDYVVEKYGKEKVVQIVTFGTMAARAVIRDVGRVLDLPYAYVDKIAKMIPPPTSKKPNITINDALEMNKELAELYQKDEQAKYMLDMSIRLEGLPRHSSVHAAGVVISKEAVDEYVPLSKGADDTITTQFTMTTLEELGLLKMDFLGLRTLTVIQNALNLINDKKEGELLSTDNMDYDDKAVFAMISAGRTEGVFQLESAGMRNFMKELKPESLEDTIDGVSLYRPGPMDFIPKYIKGKNNRSEITYLCPQLEPILKPTYGCMVYQEQVMQIVRDLAGYSYGRSDLVRRAMSKKKAAVMEKERKNFVYGNEAEGVPGCVSLGISEQVANQIFDEMTDFAEYAYNKSHAAAYTVVTYQTAYLKYYYPVEFMAALMTSVMDHATKVSEYIYHCRQMGIEILPPDINEGYGDFSVSGDKIRYGLSAIKGLGKQVIDSMIAERKERGAFLSLKDMAERLSVKEINKRTFENLIKAGALDSLPGTRKQKMSVYTQILDSVSQERKNNLTGQLSLFDFVGEENKREFDISFPEVGEYEKATLLSFEKEVLGIYISGHPLEDYEALWKKNTTNTTLDFLLEEKEEASNGEESETKVQDNAIAVIGGMITGKTVKTTKTNSTMAFITLEDLVGTVEVIVFPRDYEAYRSLLEMERKVFIKGRVNAEEKKDAKLICQKVIPFDNLPSEVWIKFSNKENFVKNEQKINELLGKNEGNDSICIYLEQEKAIKRLPKSKSCLANREFLGKLYEAFGEENVVKREVSIEKIR